MSHDVSNTSSTMGRAENELLLIPVTTSMTAPTQDLALFYINTIQTDNAIYNEPPRDVDPSTSKAHAPVFAETASGYFIDIDDFSSATSTPAIKNRTTAMEPLPSAQPSRERTVQIFNASLLLELERDW
ncbi:hypothetical protein NDU88_005047 [Pleurodeles waltl]|uniref:Uncharacterized protein n=1 Tax=Pleurodeles waltl TaxID=8319 RepID=A0AAV7V5B6_PLEWA|nr:hypothetical protein NDU88_005047 [Pleurodeles waltl]